MKRNRGFTLLELMIVITVVSVLAALAVTSYQEQVRKGKRAEAVKSLVEFMLQMEKYRASCPTYVNDTAGTNNCKDRNGDGDGSDAGVDAVYPSLADGSYYTFALSGQGVNGYVVTATKKSSFSDSKCGNLVITVANGVATRSVTSGDASYCLP